MGANPAFPLGGCSSVAERQSKDMSYRSLSCTIQKSYDVIMGQASGFGCERLKTDPRDIKLWQAVWGEAARKCMFLFVRNNSSSDWVRVELVQAPNCVVWICSDNPGSLDEVCYSFDPAKTTYPPFMLDTRGECRFGRTKTDFRNA